MAPQLSGVVGSCARSTFPERCTGFRVLVVTLALSASFPKDAKWFYVLIPSVMLQSMIVRWRFQLRGGRGCTFRCKGDELCNFQANTLDRCGGKERSRKLRFDVSEIKMKARWAWNHRRRKACATARDIMTGPI